MKRVVIFICCFFFFFGCKATDEFVLKVPETSVKVTIKDFQKASYVDDMERGVVVVFEDKIVKHGAYTFIPFVVSNQGSGVFYYIGAFKNKKHKKSFFIGDRISVEKIEVKNGSILVKYKTRYKKRKLKKILIMEK